MSWHHGDWLAFSQAVAAVLAIFGAFGVVFLQHYLQGRREAKTSTMDRLRERFRASTYAEALIGSAEKASREILDGVALWIPNRQVIAELCIATNVIDQCCDMLDKAVHQKLPTELTKNVLRAWEGVRSVAYVAHRTHKVVDMKTVDLHAALQKHHDKINAALQEVKTSRAKWEQQLLKNG
jgi:hypothetical protein